VRRRGPEEEAVLVGGSDDEPEPLKHRFERHVSVLQPIAAALSPGPSSRRYSPLPDVTVTRMATGAKVAPMEESRHSFCNEPEQNASTHGGAVTNKVITAKYTPATFLPKNLFEQFSRLANVYFLIISALQVFTPLSPTSRWSTVVPLVLVLIINMLRELYEDHARHKADDEVNARMVQVVRPSGATEEVEWQQLKLGDIVWVKANNEFPADLVLLSSSGDQGMCYIDTCNLDGETNLKIRNSIPQTSNLDNPDKIKELKGSFDYEPPNNRLYTFSGRLVRSGQPDVPVDNENILLRGSTLRNTEWIFGQIVYVGAESKIMMNQQKGRTKNSNIEHIANYFVFGFLVLLIVLVSIATACMSASWNSVETKGAWYLPYAAGGVSGIQVVEGWITILLLLNNYVPISLYVSLEIAKTVQGRQMNWDLSMYHAETDTPALTRTTNLNEELGQIQYILSDKTGTLTQNVMEFRKCYIFGTSYGFGTTEIGMAAAARGANLGGVADAAVAEAEKNADPNKAQHHRDPALSFDDCRLLEHYRAGGDAAEQIKEFMRILSVSHTVVPEGDLENPAKIKYQAESPDEGALTGFAKALGWFFCGRSATHTTVRVFGATEVFEVLNINKFNSSRKRMSVVCRTPEGKILLYVKGADNVMMERLAPAQSDLQSMRAALANYGTEGLRTLVLAKRELSEEQWAAWNKVHHAATTALVDREGELERAAEEIEKEMLLVGATAIEDKLQDGVPDAIATLARAGIKIWVLTGDKQETAENIAFACQLLNDGMSLNRIVGETPEQVKAEIAAILERHKQYIGQETEHLALIVEGKALIVIMDDEEMTTNLLKVGQMCKAVVACRVSPNQKRQVVSMVRLGVKPTPMTLAIGDGANDVPMIMEAHVGVGISGNEGLQAVRSADYAIAQFRFLKPLLLVHGRNNYIRVARVILYIFYKNVVNVTALFFYNIYMGWSGTVLFASALQVGYFASLVCFLFLHFGSLLWFVKPGS
jgi:phospholipid-transporting ATPase